MRSKSHIIERNFLLLLKTCLFKSLNSRAKGVNFVLLRFILNLSLKLIKTWCWTLSFKTLLFSYLHNLIWFCFESNCIKKRLHCFRCKSRHLIFGLALQRARKIVLIWSNLVVTVRFKAIHFVACPHASQWIKILWQLLL